MTKKANNFVSSGRDPNTQNTCRSCISLEKGEGISKDVCTNPVNRVERSKGAVELGFDKYFTPSVSITGGCDLWSDGVKRESIRLVDWGSSSGDVASEIKASEEGLSDA